MAAFTHNKPHILAVPVPAQGHIKPLMTLCRQIAKHGIKVTFVNAQCVHDRILSAAKNSVEEQRHDIVLTAVPDGLTPADDPNNLFSLLEILPKTMPEALRDLIQRINGSDPTQKISCVIADISFAWVFDVAEEMGAEPVGFSPPSLASVAMLYHVSKLLEDGTLDSSGSLMKEDAISLSDDIPSWTRESLPWYVPGNPETEKVLFELAKQCRDTHKTKWTLCNSCYELEPAASELLPELMPVGPLHLLDLNMTQSCFAPSSFFSEDADCLKWLDDKPDGSVIYVSFGSLAVFSQRQLDELALGLELLGRAFLWVSRPDLANGSRAVYPDGFLERVGEVGKIVEWAPQDEVLSHPSIGCFVSHCGWNSIVEGVGGGLPFVCWPYFADQFHNESYICDKWENGLKISFDEEGIRSRHEIKKKIEMVFLDSKFKDNALQMKEMCRKSVSEGGSSHKNLEKFIDHLRK